MLLDELFHAAVQAGGRRAAWQPELFVRAWCSLVEQSLSGYEGDLYEYEDELSVRDDLQRALDDSRLNDVDAWSGLVTAIAAADLQFRELLQNGPLVRPEAPWWRQYLLPYAGEEFAQDALRVYGVNVRRDS